MILGDEYIMCTILKKCLIIALLLITGLLECEAMYSELNKVCNELEKIAWRLPYRLSERLGCFDFKKILSENNIETLESTIKKSQHYIDFLKKWLSIFILQYVMW